MKTNFTNSIGQLRKLSNQFDEMKHTKKKDLLKK
jgi:hypothetical protein